MTDHACEVCERVFAKKSGLTAHKNRKTPCTKPAEVTEVTEVTEAAAAAPLKPLLKWVGGKTQILDAVLAHFPTEMENYHEPFVGGGSVLLGLLSKRQQGAMYVRGTIYASDWNANLIALYQNIQSHPDAFLDEIRQRVEEYRAIEGTEVNRKPQTREEAQTSPESYYYWVRSTFNALSKEEKTTPRASAMMVFLNKTCFRGVYREGPNGFNVPYGNYNNPAIYEEEHVRALSQLLQGVVFCVQPFMDSLKEVKEGDFVYLDPPYVPETATSFVGYTADGFGLQQHEALFKECNQMSTRGVRFLLSNAEVKLVKEAFPSPAYTTQILSCRRAIHSKKPDAKTNEVLITNIT